MDKGFSQTLVQAISAKRVAVMPRISYGKAAWTLALWVIGVGLIVGVWQGLNAAKGAYIVPSPWMTARDIAQNFLSSEYLIAHGVAQTSYLAALLYTTRNVLVGAAVGAGIGILVGVGSKGLPLLAEITNPVMATFGSAPIFVAAPFFLIWFGIVPGAQILMVAFYTALLLYLFARRAVENISQSHVEYALTLGSTRRTLLWRVYWPGAVPQLAGGFRIALAGAWGLEAIAELLGAQRGIGFLINFYSGAYVIQGMLSVVVLLGLVAVVVDRVAVLGIQAITRWMEPGRHVG